MKKLLVISTLILLSIVIYGKTDIILNPVWVVGFTPHDVTVTPDTCDYTDLKVTVSNDGGSIDGIRPNRSNGLISMGYSKDLSTKSVCLHYYNCSESTPSETKTAEVNINVSKNDTDTINYLSASTDYRSYTETISNDGSEGND